MVVLSLFQFWHKLTNLKKIDDISLEDSSTLYFLMSFTCKNRMADLQGGS
jgi:hypothetical protein